MKFLLEETNIERAREAFKVSFDSLKENNCILDWGYSDPPSDKGPMPRMTDPERGAIYEECLERKDDMRKSEEVNTEAYEELVKETEERFKNL